MTTIAMPQLGESVSEGTVVRWLKRIGDAIAVDEPLFEVATDKVNTEIPSLVAGVLREILVPEGSTVAVGTDLARIEAANGAPVRAAAPTSNGSRAHLRSPVVRRLAREHALDLTHLSGTGPGGRITRGDVLARIAASSKTAPATPSSLRARIAANVAGSKRITADVFSVMEADMERVAAVREAHRDAAKARDTRMTYLAFIARATIDALRAFPAVNASIDAATSNLIHHDAVHLGIAVDLDEQGLVVPVIRNADGLNVTGIARAIGTLATAARAGTLAPGDLSGSTFTITNNGAYGTLMTAPIINQPNVAILSTDAVEERVVPFQGMIAIRRRMYLCMTWDHRAFDGSTAAKFLGRIKRELEERDWEAQI